MYYEQRAEREEPEMMVVTKMLFILCAIVLVLVVVSVVTNHAVQDVVEMGFGTVVHRLGVKV